MKIFIIYESINEPTGGGNQFLKMLKKEFATQGVLSDTPEDSDILLFNSHHFLDKVYSYKKSFPNKKFVHRIDGPMRLYNDLSDPRDQQVYFANETFANATIYQSQWSMDKNLAMGLTVNSSNIVIQNCADDKIFFPRVLNEKKQKNKIRIISSSWSHHPKKGFDFYKHIDENLDFNHYDYFFAGRSPVEFKNINNLGPLTSKNLAKELRQSDIFITASQNDPCSNSLIEAISSGLVCVALNSGGHPEIVQNKDLLFNNESEFFEILSNVGEQTKKTPIRKPKSVAFEYINFFKNILK